MTAGSTRAWGLALAAGSLGLLLSGSGLLVALGTLQNAVSGQPGAPVSCAYRARTGRTCLGCGGTRALQLAAHGRLGEAFARNPLGAWAGLWLWIGAAGGCLACGTGRLRGLRLGAVLLLTSLTLAGIVTTVWWWRGTGPG